MDHALQCYCNHEMVGTGVCMEMIDVPATMQPTKCCPGGRALVSFLADASWPHPVWRGSSSVFELRSLSKTRRPPFWGECKCGTAHSSI